MGSDRIQKLRLGLLRTLLLFTFGRLGENLQRLQRRHRVDLDLGVNLLGGDGVEGQRLNLARLRAIDRDDFLERAERRRFRVVQPQAFVGLDDAHGLVGELLDVLQILVRLAQHVVLEVLDQAAVPHGRAEIAEKADFFVLCFLKFDPGIVDRFDVIGDSEHVGDLDDARHHDGDEQQPARRADP